MKNIRITLLSLALSLIIPQLLSQDEAWERIIPTPQEHHLYCVQRIPGTEKLVAAGGGCTIMYSEDDGESWDITLNAANFPNNTTFLSIGFSDENTGYAVTQDGKIIKTADGGENWSLVFAKSVPYGAYYKADMHIFHADTLIIIGIQDLILKTKNGGVSWDTLDHPPQSYHESIDFINKDTGFIVGWAPNPSILKTTDQGENWSMENIPFPEIKNFSDIYFTNDSTGFLVGSDRDVQDATIYILKTTNYGNDWDSVFTSTYAYDFGKIDFKDEMHGCVRIYSWWNSFVYTEDGGETWVHDDDSFWYNYTPCYSFLYEPDYLFGVGRNGRIGKSYAMENEWIGLTHDWDAGLVVDVDFTSAQTAYALHQNKTGGLLQTVMRKTTDGGHSWNNSSSGLPGGSGSLSFITDNLGYLLFDDYFDVLIYRTTDGSESWSKIYNFGEYDLDYRIPIFLSFIDSLQGIAAFEYNVLKTQDGGYSWESVLSFDTDWDQFTSLLYLSPDSIFITGYEGQIPFVLKSNDGGENFEYQYINLVRGYSEKVYFMNHSTGFLLINYVDNQKGGRIYKTEDGGNSWFETITNDTNYIYYQDIYFTSDDIGYAVGESNKTNAFKTTDGGENWEPIETACSSGLKFIHFFDDWHGLVFGDKGLILETFSGGVVGMEVNPFVANAPIISVFPNPTVDKITIQLEEAITTDIYLEVYNLQGKCLARKYYPNASFKLNISLDISKLPPGLYTCRVKNGNSQSTSKVVKL